MLTLLALAVAAMPVADPVRLVCDLGSPRWCVRESAQCTLEQQGWPVSGVLRRAIATHPDPEVRMRARRVLDVLLERELNRMGPYPMIDGLWWNHTLLEYHTESAAYACFAHYLHRRDDVEDGNPPYKRYRAASRDLAREMLLKGYEPWVIAGLLYRAHLGDQSWLSGQIAVKVPPGCPDGRHVWRGVPPDPGRVGPMMDPDPMKPPPPPPGGPVVRPGPMLPARN